MYIKSDNKPEQCENYEGCFLYRSFVNSLKQEVKKKFLIF